MGDKRDYIRTLRDIRTRVLDAFDCEALDAAIAALESPRLPKGWVAVPQFPTNEMVDASMIRVPIAKRIPAGATFKVLGARAWDAMIAAAPKLAGEVSGE